MTEPSHCRTLWTSENAQAFGQVGRGCWMDVAQTNPAGAQDGTGSRALRRCNPGIENEWRKHGNGNENEPRHPLYPLPPPRTSGGRYRTRAVSATGAARPGLEFERYFSTAGLDPFEAVEWETRDALIGNEKGEKVFEQKGVEVPKFWSQTATNVVVSKYFRGELGTPQRETSVRQLIGRVVDAMTQWGRDGRLLRLRGERRDLPRGAGPHSAQPVCLLQLAGVVQRRHRGPAAVLGLLHQLGRGHDAVDPRPRQDRGHALQVRLGHRLEPLLAALLARELSPVAARLPVRSPS